MHNSSASKLFPCEKPVSLASVQLGIVYLQYTRAEITELDQFHDILKYGAWCYTLHICTEVLVSVQDTVLCMCSI